MVISELIIKIPYYTIWQIKKWCNKLDGFVFYVASWHDFQIIEYILPHLHISYTLTSRNKKVLEDLSQKGFQVKKWPVYPTLLMMVRHAFHLFPVKQIKKIGIRHGPYHFKRMIHAEKYNLFDQFLFTSSHEAAIATAMGIKGAMAGGYPRLDAFRDARVLKQAHSFFLSCALSEKKKTLLFTATWDKSKMSAVHMWADQLHLLTGQFNILVSLHPAMANHWKDKVQKHSGVKLILSEQLPKAMLLADFLIGDTSSVIAEFCALDKPVITFRVPPSPRLTPEIAEMIKEISYQISHIKEIPQAIQYLQANPLHKSNERKFWNKLIFDDLSILHGKKVAEVIMDFTKTNL